MIGGNVKSLLPDGCHLSLPTVADGRTLSLRVRGSEAEIDASYTTGEYLFKVTILKSIDTEFTGAMSRAETVGEATGV